MSYARLERLVWKAVAVGAAGGLVGGLLVVGWGLR